MEIVHTIVPIFLIVVLGWFVRKKGFLPTEFLGPANRLVYYLAIPAMIFRSLSKAPVGRHFQGGVLFATLAAAAIGYGLAWLICVRRRMPGARAGTFIQSAGHGNLGYIGLSVSLYFLGEDGLARASLIGGFLMILQNFLSVFALQVHSPGGSGAKSPGALAAKMLGNPVIASAMAGIFASVVGIPVPIVLQRSMDMLGGMAPPTALLLIGGSLSMSGVREFFRPAAGAVMIKLLVLPGLGMMFFHQLGISPADFLPGLILLASPTATVTYVMSREMNGDADFAVATISASTLLSAGTFGFWLMAAEMFH